MVAQIVVFKDDRVIRENESTKVMRLDDAGPGNAFHEYAVTSPEGKKLLACTSFQNGPLQEAGCLPGAPP